MLTWTRWLQCGSRPAESAHSERRKETCQAGVQTVALACHCSYDIDDKRQTGSVEQVRRWRGTAGLGARLRSRLQGAGVDVLEQALVPTIVLGFIYALVAT